VETQVQRTCDQEDGGEEKCFGAAGGRHGVVVVVSCGCGSCGCGYGSCGYGGCGCGGCGVKGGGKDGSA